MADQRFQGMAGIYRVAMELSLRGEACFFPSVDTGVDLLTGSGKRVQVKSAILRTSERGNYPSSQVPGYFFCLGWGQKGSKQRLIRRPRKYSEEVDLVVLWGIDEDRLWIVPSAELDTTHGLLLRPGRTAPLGNNCGQKHAARIYQYESRWDLLVPVPPPNPS